MDKSTTIQSVEIVRPDWARGRHIDETGFCQDFSGVYPLIWVEGAFFTWRGMEPEDRVRKWIYDYIKPYYSTQMTQRVNTLVQTLKMELQKEDFPQAASAVHCKNGVYDAADNRFLPRLNHCRCRLPVNYNPDAPKPALWIRFLEELLEQEDILTLQEFMGYCLLPVNYAQRMLLIIGSGGEGKSRIGIVASRLFGQAMVNGSLNKLEKSPFARADLQHKLLMVDDDLQLEALTTTGIIKSIVTAEQPLDLERKGVQSYQARLHCRLMAFGNGNLRSLHDRSHGFFRRQIILTTKPKPAQREDNPYLAEELSEELEGILLWCIEGLRRLLYNNMHFTLSRRAEENLREAENEGNNALSFLQSQGYIRLEQGHELTTRKLYEIYRQWCDDNALNPLSCKTFSSSLQANAHRFGLQYSNRIRGGNDLLVRGFRGIRSCGRF